jgi:hypothetical protein
LIANPPDFSLERLAATVLHGFSGLPFENGPSADRRRFDGRQCLA